MSLAITHFAVGAASTLLLVWVTDVGTQYRASLATGGGLWALVPDAHYLFPSPYADPFVGIKHLIVGDLFWFHATLDGMVQGRGTRTGAAISLLLLFSVAVSTEWKTAPWVRRNATTKPDRT